MEDKDYDSCQKNHMRVSYLRVHAGVLLVIFFVHTILVLSIFLTIFLRNGVIESIDIIWGVVPQKWSFGAYNEFVSGDSVILLPTQTAYVIPYLLSMAIGISLAQKFTLFGYLIGAGLSAAYLTVRFLSNRANFIVMTLCGLTSALLYGFNPFVLEQLWHVSYLWSYAWFPLAYFMLISSIRKPILPNVLLTGLFSFFITADPYAFFNLVILFGLTLPIAPCLLQGVSIQSSYTRAAKVIVGTSVVTILCSSSWFLPFVSNPQVAPYWRLENSTEDLISFVNRTSPSFVDSYSLLLPSEVAVIVFLFLTALSLPLFLLNKRALAKSYSELIPLVFAMMLGLFLSSGPNGPSSWLYVVLLRVFPVPWLLKFPSFFLVLVALALAIIVPLGIFEATTKFKSTSKIRIQSKKQIMAILVVALILIALYVPVGLQLRDRLEPTSVPSEYFVLTDFLTSQYVLAPYRTVWLPLGTPQWANPLANKLEYWLSPVPYVSYGFGVTTPGLSNVANSLYEALENDPSRIDALIRLLGIYSVKYIIVHNDTLIDFSNKIINSLNKSSAVYRLIESKYYSLYVNRYFCDYVYIPGFVILTNDASSSYLANIIQNSTATQNGVCFAVINEANTSWWVRSLKGSLPLYHVQRIGDAMWQVEIKNATGPVAIILNEPFSYQWKIDGLSNNLVRHLVANNIVNGWIINKTGSFSFTIVYAPEMTYKIGIALSGATFFVVLFIILTNAQRPEDVGRRILAKSKI